MVFEKCQKRMPANCPIRRIHQPLACIEKDIMIIARIFFSFVVLSFLPGCAGDNESQNVMSEEDARTIVYESINNPNLHNAIGQSTILGNRDQVKIYAELVLFEIYGKENIESQKPYDIFEIDDYWLLKGNLNENEVGGVFLIIIDSRDGRIIRMSHEK